MIVGNQKTEKEYRSLPIDSASSLKEFAQDRRKYKKRFVDLERVEEEKTAATITGDLVDLLLLTKENFDNKFFLSSVVKGPTGNMELFVNSLLRYSKEPYENFEEIARKAYKDSGYKWAFEKVLEKFIGSDAEIWFKENLEIQSKGLTVVSLDQVNNAERIVQDLKENEVTKNIINLVSSDRYLVQNQVQIEGFEVDGLPLKAQLDKIIIDRKEKTISSFDLKCTFSVENFTHDYYMYRGSYFQSYVYKEACLKLKQELGLDYYHVNNLCFIVCDSIGYMNPLLYKLTQDDMEDSYLGFSYNNRKYMGVKETVEELKWSKETGIWNISKRNYENNGVKYLRN